MDNISTARTNAVHDTIPRVSSVRVVGLMPSSFGLFGVFLMPVLAAVGLRRLWSGAKGQHRLEPD